MKVSPEYQQALIMDMLLLKEILKVKVIKIQQKLVFMLH